MVILPRHPRSLALLGFLSTHLVQSAWFLGGFEESCFSVCQSESLECFSGSHDEVNTPLETLFVSLEELNIDCLAVDAVQESENIPSLPRVRVDNDGRYALCQYTVASSPVSLCASVPPASYRRFCCCGTSADDCPTLDDDPPSISNPTDDGEDTDDKDGFDFWSIFGIMGLILAILTAIGGAIGAAVGLGFAIGESDSD